KLFAVLNRAYRITPNADFAARIAAVGRAIAQPAPDAQHETVGEALIDLLKWHAALSPRPRSVPSDLWQQVLLRRANITDLPLTACAGALVWQASYLFLPSAGPAIWEPLARLLAILLVVHGVFGALTVVISAVLLYRSHARFRSLLITRRPISDPLVRRAIAAMAPHGKLFAFLLDQPQPPIWPDPNLDSLASDIIFTDEA